MAEVLRSIEEPVRDLVTTYRARVVGRLAEDKMWEGWLEFEPVGGQGDVLVGPVESRQPRREHLEYWASGLSPVYVEGAVRRARNPIVVRTRVIEQPLSDRPAPRVIVTGPPREHRPDAILDPFEIGARSLDILGQELRALNRPRLLNIIAAYDLNPGHRDLSWMTDSQLAHFIVVAVETQLHQRSR